MRILIPTCLALATMIGAAATASAQSIIIIALCTQSDSDGPTFSALQASDAVGTVCMDITSDNREFCQAISGLSAAAGTGLACAEADFNRFTLGLEKTFFGAVAPGPRVIPGLVDAEASDDGVEHSYLFQNNQTNIQFLMERADGELDVVGCNVLAADGPRATYVQKSDLARSGHVEKSCANALQDTDGLLSRSGSAVVPGVRLQQGRALLDADVNEAARPAEFVIVRIWQVTTTPN